MPARSRRQEICPENIPQIGSWWKASSPSHGAMWKEPSFPEPESPFQAGLAQDDRGQRGTSLRPALCQLPASNSWEARGLQSPDLIHLLLSLQEPHLAVLKHPQGAKDPT